MTAKSLSPKRPWEGEYELPSGRSEHRYPARPPDPVTPPIAADPPASSVGRPRSVTSRRTTVIAAMGESSAVAGPAGRYLLRSTVWTLPMAKSVAFLAASRLAALERMLRPRLAIFGCMMRTPEVAPLRWPSLPSAARSGHEAVRTPGGSRPGGATPLRHRFPGHVGWGHRSRSSAAETSVHSHLAVHRPLGWKM
jgi:hypothetical protein